MRDSRTLEMSKPGKEEIDAFYKEWWLENFMIPLNKTPMGLTDFIGAFYDKYCDKSEADKDS